MITAKSAKACAIGLAQLKGSLTKEIDNLRTLLIDALAIIESQCNDYGIKLAIHNHGRKHRYGSVAALRDIFAKTSPNIGLCLDTGHVAYCGADNLKLIADYPDRMVYVHLKQVDRAIHARVREEKLGFAPAVRLGAMVEPPLGEPDMVTLLAALGALDRDLFCIVEQDMYPCAFDRPLPIAIRTQQYFKACGLTAGRPLG